jgi:ankyrin repeat protein
VIEGQAIQGTEQDNLDKFYGKSPFRCPVLRCPYFVNGFGTHKERERHCNSHRRSFMCPYDTCDYSVLGLPSDSALKTHLGLCHEDLPQTPVFPDIKTRTLEQALEDAIAANNLLAITTLATELTFFPARKTGFVLQALTLRYRKAALTLLDLLGTPSELNHVHKKSTAILKACEIGDEELFDILVKKGADINTRVGESALTIASQNCHISIARKLLDDKNYKRSLSRASYTTTGALAMASTYGHLEAVSLLLEKDSDHFVKKETPRDFNRALNAAIKEKKVSCAKLLLDWALKKDLSILPTKLRKFSEENTDYMIEILYTERAKVIEEGGGTKGNVLQAAARKGDCEAVSHLLDLGADIDNFKGSYGTPMIAAASNGKLEVVRLLLERGADVKRKDDQGYGTGGSAIDGAAADCHETVVRELLDKGAVFTHESIHRINHTEHTSLQALSRRANSAALVRLLLENGANVDAVANILRESRRPLQLAVEYGENVTLQVLLEYGADANAKSDDQEGNTALHIAVKVGNPAKLGILLDHGADINAINNNGQTALIVGATYSWEKYRQVFHILIERGADIEMADKDGNTALIFAAKHRDQPLEMIQILIQRVADSSTRNLKGLTALMIAANCGNALSVECLLQHRTSQDIEGNSEVWRAVECLLQHRTSQDIEGNSEVWRAAESATQRGQVETVRVLLKSLSKTALRDHQYLLSVAMSLECSKVFPNSDMISLLAEYGATVIPPAQESSVPHEFWDQTAVVEGYQDDQELFYTDQDFQDDVDFQMEKGIGIGENDEGEVTYDIERPLDEHWRPW